MPQQKSPDDQLALDLDLANDLKAVTAPADDLDADLALANDLLAVQQPAARPAPMSAHGWTDPASVRVTPAPAQPFPPSGYGNPSAHGITDPASVRVTPGDPHGASISAARPNSALPPIPGGPLADEPAPLAQIISAVVEMFKNPPVQSGEAHVLAYQGKDREALVKQSAAQIIESVGKAAQPVTAIGAVLNPISTGVGIVAADLTAKGAAAAIKAAGGDENDQRLAADIAAFVVGSITANKVRQGLAAGGAAARAARGPAVPPQAPINVGGSATPAARPRIGVEQAQPGLPSPRVPPIPPTAPHVVPPVVPPPAPPAPAAPTPPVVVPTEQVIADYQRATAAGDQPAAQTALAELTRRGVPTEQIQAAMQPAPAEPPAALDADLKAAETALAVQAARADVNTQPTDGQKAAGNFQKGHVTLHGLDITIENPVGSVRSGKDADGNEWSVQMPADYGYVKRTEGADGDNVDVYIGPDHQSQTVFVIDQVDPKTGKFDETKSMIGFNSLDQAVAAYDSAFSDGTGPSRRGAVVSLPVETFKEWTRDGETQEPAARSFGQFVVQALDQREEPVSQPEHAVVQELRGERNQDGAGVGGELRGVRGGGGGTPIAEAPTGSNQERRPLREGQPSVGDEEGASAQPAKEPTGDVSRTDVDDSGVGGGDRAGAVSAALPSVAGREDDGRASTDDAEARRTAPNSEFLKLYEEQLRLYHAKGQYSWPIESAAGVAARMGQALADGSANTDGAALKATAKRLRIKNTNAGWREYFTANPLPQAAVPAPGSSTGETRAVLYHGTNQSLDSIRAGSFFAESRHEAEMWARIKAERDGGTPRVYEVPRADVVGRGETAHPEGTFHSGRDVSALKDISETSQLTPPRLEAPPEPERQPFGYDEWAAQYRAAFEAMQRYTPDQIGSQKYAEKMAKLADDNPDYIERFEREDDEAAKPGDDEDAQADAYAAKREAEYVPETITDTPTLASVDDLLAVVEQRKAEGKPTYLRISDPDKDLSDPSYVSRIQKHVPGRKTELGMSTVRLWNADEGYPEPYAKTADPRQDIAAAASDYIHYFDGGPKGERAWLVTGALVGYGYDGEPLLRRSQKLAELTNKAAADLYREWATSTGDAKTISDVAATAARMEARPDHAGVESAQEETTDDAPDDADGRPAAASEPDEPVGGAGADSPEDVAGEPGAGGGVQEPASKPKRARTRSPRKSRAGESAGATAPSGGDVPGGGAVGQPAAHVDTADTAKDDDVADAHARGEAPRFFTIENVDVLTEGAGWVGKLDANMTALRLLKQLQAEARPATDAEQAVLARYIGWGHTELAPIVDLQERLSDGRKTAARQELETLLTARELQTVGLTTPNAHYSFHDLPVAMWELAERLGFKGGTVLEPAIGTGHFIGTMPGTIRAHKHTRVFGVDMEPIAAGIAAQLYQGARIQNRPLQEAVLPDNYFDIAISNVPFGRIRVFDPAFVASERAVMTRSVHNYYFGKALDLVRPGGLVLFVTSRFTMDSQNDSVRKYLDQRAIFLGAIRLPNKAFDDTAGTEVVTDVIVLQRRGEGVTTPSAGAWLDVAETAELTDKHGYRPTKFNINEYFIAHPEMVLGKQDATGKMARTSEPQYNVVGSVTPHQLSQAVAQFRPNVYKPTAAKPRKIADPTQLDARQGAFVVTDGKLYTFDKGTLEESTLKGKNLQRAIAFVPLRDAYLAVLEANVTQADDAALAAAQKKLKREYDTFVKAFGFINTAENRVVLEADPNAARIVTLEDIEYGPKEKGKRAQVRVKGLADIFAKRLMAPPAEPTTATDPLDALVTSRAWRGRVDLDWMAQLTGKPFAELTKYLSAKNELFHDPVTGAWEPRDEYLSGDVVTKLAQAKAAADTDKEYKANVAALEAVAPTPLTIDDFYDGGLGRSAPFGATWVPAELFTRFLEDTGGSQVQLRLLNTDAKTEWYVDAYGNHEFRPTSTDYQKWVHAALNGRTPKVVVKDESGKEMIDPELTLQLQQSVKQLREQWSAWWKTDAVAAEQIVAIYNAMFNREVATKVDGSNLLLPNANPGIILRPGQKDSIARTLNRGNTYLAQAVGWGKTYEMIAIASEWKRRGLASKVMIVVPNHLVEQWRRDFVSMYPAARVLMTTKDDYAAGARKRLIARIANNDWDAVVVGQSQFLRIGVKLETLRAFIDEQEQQLLAEGAAQLNMSVEDFSAAVDEYGGGSKKTVITGRGSPRSAKDIARQILNLRAQLQKRLNAAAKDPIEFETLGVDALIVDEAHEFKNLYFSSSHNNIAGLKGSASDKALDMYLKVRLINEQSGQRNVVFASATPISNTMSELYTAFRYLDMKGLRRLGISGFDSWMSGYATADGKLEPTAAGGFKERVRLRTWTNGQELFKLFSRFADVITREEVTRLGLLKLPKENTVTVSTDAPPEMPEFMATIKMRAEQLATGKVKPTEDNHLWVSSHASLAAIDLRLVPARFGGLPANAPVNPNGRIASVAREVVKRYKASQDTKGTQLVFLDIGVPKGDAIPPLPASVLNTKAEEIEETEEDTELTGEAEPEPDDDAMGAVAFNLYGELTANLVKAGIKRDEIAYIHQATTPHELGKLFTAVKEGTIRVLLSTRAKGGTGMNVQDRIVAIHHVDVPWRPDQLEQANGRGIRQGNTNAEVDIVKYVTPGSYDQYRWYLLGIKQGFISRFLKGEVGNMEDVDPQQLDMEMAAALGSGDSRVLELINTERDIEGLRARAKNWRLRNDAAKREVGSYQRMIAGLEAELAEMAPTRAKLAEWVNDGKPVVIDTAVGGSTYYRTVSQAKPRTFSMAEKDGREALNEALAPFMVLDYMPTEGARLGHAGPYDLRVLPIERRETRIVNGNMETNDVRSSVLAVFKDGKMVGHTPEWDKNEPPDLVRSLAYHTAPDRIDAKEATLTNGIASHKTNLANAERIAGKSFDQSAQLEMMELKLTELRTALDGSQRPAAPVDAPPDDDQPTSGASGGSVGAYAQPAAAGQPNRVQPIQFPELVELARELQATPSVVRAFRNDQQRGQFSERGIRLRADLFKAGNEFQLAATLAHEIGHLIDWLPSRSLKRGNLIGRLFSLRSYMKWKFNAPDGSTIHNKEIKAELMAVSDAWRPWDRDKATDHFKKYRESSRELYADAISVLLNDPQRLEAEAPIFFKQFFDGLDQKPDVKAAYFDLQTTLAGTPAELTARRRAGVQQMFTLGDTAAMDLERQRQAEKGLQRKELWERIRAQHVDKHTPIIDKVRELEKRGTRLNPDDDPRFALEERNYLGGKLKAFTDKHFLPIYRTLTEAGIGWHEFGEALFYERIIAGDRSELANPRGISPTVATDLLQALVTGLTAAQRPVIRAQMDAFRAIIKDVAGDAYQAGLYTDALYKQMRDNPAYVAFRVIEHIDKDVTSRVYRQIGTLKDITNPADASMLKVLVTLRAIEHNKVKQTVFDFLEKHSPDAIEQAKEIWTGKGHRPVDPKDHDRRMITYFVAGRLRGKYVSHAIADSLENTSVGGNMAIIAGLRWMNSGLFRPVFTSFNAGFQSYNFARDFLRFWKNTPTMTVTRALRRYAQAVPLARVRAFGINERGASMKLRLAHKELIQAEEAGLLSVTFNDLSKGRHVEDTQIEDTLQRMGVGGFSAAKPAKGLARILKPIVTWMTEVGDFIETLPKAAALYEYKGAGTIAEIPADVRSFIRRKIGSPDYLAGGTHKPITNELFLFSNAITQALRADYEVATEGAPVPPKPQAGGGSGGSGTPPPSGGNAAGPSPFDRANFWWKTAATNIVPKLWWFAVLYLLTKDSDTDGPLGRLRQMARAVSEYDMTNYLVVPLGIDGKGNVTYVRVPQDDSGRLLGGLAWKLLRAASGDKDVWKSAMQVFDYTAGQVPGLTPSLGLISDVAQMASGRNVYDPFRSRFLFTDDEMAAGGAQKIKKFIGYEFQELGGGVVWKFYAGEQRPRERTTGQVILDLPILSNVLGRWIKVSNFGEVERLRDVQHEQQGDEARARLAERAAVSEALTAYRKLPAEKKNREALVAATDAIVAKLYADLPGQQKVEKGRRILTKLKMGNTRASSDALLDVVMSATSNAQKVAVIKEAAKGMSKEELTGWVNQAAGAGAISGQVRASILTGK